MAVKIERGGVSLAAAIRDTYSKGATDYYMEPLVAVDGQGAPLGKVQGVNSKGLNLRKLPRKDAEIIAAYPVGTGVEILGIYDSIWAHVRLQDGNSGYMMLQYLGGEPEKAAKNSFAVTRDTALTDFDGNVLFELKKGDCIPITERPVDGGKEQFWIRTNKVHGYFPADAANFW